MRNIPDKSDDVGDVLPATDFNAEKNELQNTVTSSDQTLDPEGGPDTDLNQLSKAIAAYANAGATYTDSGTADAYVLGIATNLKTVPEYLDNMAIIFKAGNSNAGASTVNVNSLGVKDLQYSDGQALIANEVVSGEYVIAVYNLSDDRFEVVNARRGVDRGKISGLRLVNGTDTDHDIDIQVGTARDSLNEFTMTLASVMTKQIDAAWSAGTNQGGMFTGSVANDTWYHTFIIRKDSDGSIDAGFDTSITAANIPAGYTAYKRVGSVLTDGSANILQFVDIELSGGSVRRGWKSPILDLDTGGAGPTPVNVTVSTPPGIKSIAHFNISASTGGAANTWYISDPDITDQAPSSTAAPLATISVDSTLATVSQADVVTNDNPEVRYRSVASSTTLKIATLGYTDRRV
jgi:hypothetical protein